jgi:hypothetical protein
LEIVLWNNKTLRIVKKLFGNQTKALDKLKKSREQKKKRMQALSTCAARTSLARRVISDGAAAAACRS